MPKQFKTTTQGFYQFSMVYFSMKTIFTLLFLSFQLYILHIYFLIMHMFQVYLFELLIIMSLSCHSDIFFFLEKVIVTLLCSYSGVEIRRNLLENSPVCQITKSERKYYCFYLLCATPPEVFYNILLINLFLYICHFKYKFYFKLFFFNNLLAFSFYQGGFDMICNKRYKIETLEQLSFFFFFFLSGLFIDFLPSFYALRLIDCKWICFSV